MSKGFKISFCTGIVLLAYILLCRQNIAFADFYSLHLYPSISAFLSFIASAVPFSLQEILIVIFIVLLLGIPFWAKKKRIRWNKALAYEANLVLWIYVWLYLGWGINYFRSNIFLRAEKAPAAYEQESFSSFLQEFTTGINNAYTPSRDLDKNALELYAKSEYQKIDKKFGLGSPKSYQHPKKQMFDFLQSAVGVSGYIGPYMDETHVNSAVRELEYPFTYIHEYAHVLGIAMEAEANYWSYKLCTSSPDPVVRYSGYFSLLPFVWNNAKRLLPEEEFIAWKDSLNPAIIDDALDSEEYWEKLRWGILEKTQRVVYNWFLKSNNIPSGTKNYSEVLLIIMSLDD
ncbi:MAG: DUF3810 domain-containing protein [Bacteroidales bacterium]|nr:DUF3810 domain-containing protein [Bacteroidales bacterium]